MDNMLYCQHENAKNLFESKEWENGDCKSMVLVLVFSGLLVAGFIFHEILVTI